MGRMLVDIYQGTIQPAARRYRKSPKRNEVNRELDEKMTYLRNKLPQEDHALLNEVENLCTDLGICEIEDSFACGFRLGALMMVEIFTDTGQSIASEMDDAEP